MPKFTFPSSSTHYEYTYKYISETNCAYVEEMHEISLILAILRLLEDGLNDIVSILIEHQILENLRVLHQMSKKQSLRVNRRWTTDSALNHIWGYLLCAVICQFITYKLCNLNIDLFVVVLQYLLNDIVAVLIINQSIKLCKTYVHQCSLYCGVMRPQNLLDHTATMFVSCDFCTVANYCLIYSFFMILQC